MTASRQNPLPNSPNLLSDETRNPIFIHIVRPVLVFQSRAIALLPMLRRLLTQFAGSPSARCPSQCRNLPSEWTSFATYMVDEVVSSNGRLKWASPLTTVLLQPATAHFPAAANLALTGATAR